MPQTWIKKQPQVLPLHQGISVAPDSPPKGASAHPGGVSVAPDSPPKVCASPGGVLVTLGGSCRGSCLPNALRPCSPSLSPRGGRVMAGHPAQDNIHGQPTWGHSCQQHCLALWDIPVQAPTLEMRGILGRQHVRVPSPMILPWSYSLAPKPGTKAHHCRNNGTH